MDVLSIYREAGAYHEGHFLLASGRHSDRFLQSTTVLQHPKYADQIGLGLAQLLKDTQASFVIGPAMGGVVLAYVTARGLNIRALFAEKDGKGGMTIRDAFKIAQGERFVAVEDVLTTGGSVLKAVRAAEACGGEAVAIACIIDRRQNPTDLEGVPVYALQQMYFETYAPDALPEWLAERPLQEI